MNIYLESVDLDEIRNAAASVGSTRDAIKASIIS